MIFRSYKESMEISKSQRQAYSEIDEFLELLTEDERNEIPLKLRELFKREKDPEYKKGINPNIPIKDQNLKSETLALIALLNLQYWCKDENEKERLKKIYADNEKKYQDELREKYNPDNIFKKAEELNKDVMEEHADLTKENTQLVEYNENFIKKIFKKFLKIFGINKKENN